MLLNMPSPAQIRAARAMLNWSRDDLAVATGLSADSIFKIEKGSVQARGTTRDQLTRSFLQQGVIFTDNDGVQRQATDIQIYKGREGFVSWAEDVYQTVKDGGDIAISGSRESYFAQWLSPEQSAERTELMAAIGDKLVCRAILKEGDFDFAYSAYATYKWIDGEHWDSDPIYVYGSKLALIEFHEDGPIITVINSSHAARAFRKMFMSMWDSVCRPIPTRRREIL
jgi:DNA-binding XRE family transcriptional regulator